MRVLIVSSFIAPVASIASIRWTKLGKYLSMRGFVVDVLTDDKSFSAGKKDAKLVNFDETLYDDLKYFDNYITIRNPLILRAAYIAKNRKSQKQMPPEWVNKSSDVSAMWNTRRIRVLNSCTSWMAKLFYRSLAKEYDVVISSFCPYWPHIVASFFKRINPSLIWLADYRDSPLAPQFGEHKYNKLYPIKYSSQADAILYVSEEEGQGLAFGEMIPEFIVSNGFDYDDVSPIQRKAKPVFNLVYTGTLYTGEQGRSDLTPLFRALNELVKRKLIVPADICVSYAGSSGHEFEMQASGFPSIPTLNRGLISRSEALSMQAAASALILCTWNSTDSKGIVTGKIFEYFVAQVPVIGLCSGNLSESIVKTMLSKSNTGYCYEEANDGTDYPLLVEYLLTLYTQWKSTGVTECNTEWEYVNTFSYQELARKLEGIIKELDDKKG